MNYMMYNNMLIGVLGRKRVGKDTVSDYLCDQYGFNKITLAQPLKDVCELAFKFSDEQLYGSLKEVVDVRYGVSPRIVYQYLGTEIFRKDINRIIPCIKNNFWINLVAENYLRNIDKCKYVVVSDVRFKNEIDRIHELGGIVIKVNREVKEELSGVNMSAEYDFSKLEFGEELKEVCRILFNFSEEQLYGSLMEIKDERFGVSPEVIFKYLEEEVFREGVVMYSSNMHESEKDIDLLEADYEILNDGSLKDLYKKTDNIVKAVFK